MPRPANVADLFVDGAAYDNWAPFNWNARRFFILNVRLVMGLMRIEHTTMGEFFDRAPQVITSSTDWNDQFRGDYHASKTQIYPKSAFEPKLFDKACASIVALE